MHVTLLTMSGIFTLDLCEKCKSMADALEIHQPANQIHCSRCGTSLLDIGMRGRLGCAEDYLIFADHLAKGLFQYHGSSQHVGKVPKRKNYF